MKRQTIHNAIHPARWPLLVAFTYLVFGVLWIVSSDRIASAIVRDQEALTRVQTYKGWGFIVVTAVLLFVGLRFLVGARQRAESALQRSQMQFRRLIESANDGVCVLDRDGGTVFVNQRLCRMIDVDEQELLNRQIAAYLDERGVSRLTAMSDACRIQGNDEFEIQLIRADRSSSWAIVSASAVTDERGEFDGCILVITNITERKRTETQLVRAIESERRLLNELHHRVRNNLASLNALINMSRRSATSVDEFAQTINGRVSAMATVHSLLAESKWKPILLADLLSALTTDSERNCVRFNGPAVQIVPGQASPLASIIHELITNARKHGALSTSDGTVEISCNVHDTDRSTQELSLQWIERSSRTIDTDCPPGEGLPLVEGMVRSDLRGEIEYTFGPQGIHVNLRVPLVFAEGVEAETAAFDPAAAISRLTNGYPPIAADDRSQRE